jgi:hypothetical protein
MPVSRALLSALAALILTASAACAASDGRIPGDIGGVRAARAAIDRPGPVIEVDLELILAVDISDSMSRAELTEQRKGYIAAFRHPEVIAAIAGGPLGRIAVAYVEWAGPDDQFLVLPWTILGGADDSTGFAADLAARPLKPAVDMAPYRTGTSISAALTFAAGLFADNGINSIGRAIDISGDGPNNTGLRVTIARSAVIRQGITINGLPLIFAKRTLPVDVYYRDCVIGGPGAFSIAVSDTAEFAVAIRRKLVLEIADLRPGATAPGGHPDARPSPPGLCDRWHRGSPPSLQVVEPRP